jgi:hypothetical protein
MHIHPDGSDGSDGVPQSRGKRVLLMPPRVVDRDFSNSLVQISPYHLDDGGECLWP